MPAVKYAAIGMQLWISDGGASPETYFKVASVADIVGPKAKADTIDSTTHDTTDGYRDFIASLKDGQEVTFPVWLDPNEATHNETATVVGTNAGGLKYLFEQRVKRNMKLVMPVSPVARVRFTALVTGYEFDFKVAGGIMANIVLKVNKEPVLEAGS
jgi:hypothetical protein